MILGFLCPALLYITSFLEDNLENEELLVPVWLVIMPVN